MQISKKLSAITIFHYYKIRIDIIIVRVVTNELDAIVHGKDEVKCKDITCTSIFE